MERNAGGEERTCSLRAKGAGLLDQVHLGAGDGGGGYESAVFGADEGQVALGNVGAVFGGLQLALESSHSGHALLRNSLLKFTEIFMISFCYVP